MVGRPHVPAGSMREIEALLSVMWAYVAWGKGSVECRVCAGSASAGYVRTAGVQGMWFSSLLSPHLHHTGCSPVQSMQLASC